MTNQDLARKRLQLSKSRYLAGQQCPKRLWLETHEPDAPELVPGPRLEALFAHGHEVGDLARKMFPGGVLVDRAVHIERGLSVVDTTRELIASGVDTVYEAAFAFADLFCAIDVLHGEAGRWTVTEVKSSTKAKPEHLTDLAFQVHVAAGAGLEVVSAELMHINRDCVAPDLGNLFEREDLTDSIAPPRARVQDDAARMLGVLGGPEPSVKPGAHCKRPYECPFISRCCASADDRDVGVLYRIGKKQLATLHVAGHRRIDQIPAHWPLTEVQNRQRDAVLTDGIAVDFERLRGTLDGLVSPVAFLDFESIARPVPSWDGTRPWQQLTVQFSLHLDHDGLHHVEHLVDGPSDGRKHLARRLLAATAGTGSVVVWNQSFEKARLRELADACPDLGSDLAELSDRLVDLMVVVRECVYATSFGGSFSLKKVAPALLDEDVWGHVGTRDGGTASAMLGRVVLEPDTLTSIELERLRSDLLAYCQADTLATVKILRRLRALVELGANPTDEGANR